MPQSAGQGKPDGASPELAAKAWSAEGGGELDWASPELAAKAWSAEGGGELDVAVSAVPVVVVDVSLNIGVVVAFEAGRIVLGHCSWRSVQDRTSQTGRVQSWQLRRGQQRLGASRMGRFQSWQLRRGQQRVEANWTKLVPSWQLRRL